MNALPKQPIDSSKKPSYQLLQEKPVQYNDSLQFGHTQIIETLKSLIVENDFNLTIGLFGGWGSGKSSIIQGLKVDLEKSSIPLVLFDVWKHEGDALRRTFLKEIDQQLSALALDKLVKTKNILSDRVSHSVTETIDKYELNLKKLGVHFLAIAALTLALTIPVIVLYNFFKFVFSVDIFNTISIPSISSLLITLFTGGILYKYLDSFIRIKKIDTKKDRLSDPYEFESEFKRIIQNFTDTNQKVVITFDNLDRVSGENALNIISTIKTFLDFTPESNENQRVYFLIPCDMISIKNHLQNTLKVNETLDKNLYIDEFLRKFFNTSIWIPEFYHTELETFAKQKLEETKIKAFENDLLDWLIIRVFNDNPRQIIQFINILVSNYVLLKKFCENNEFADSLFYRKNVPQLAKFLLLKQRHPDIIEAYRSKSIYNLSNPSMLETINDDNFKILLSQTLDINILSLEPFFKYRISSQEQLFPGISNLMQKIAEEDVDLANIANDIGIKNNQRAFFNVALDHWNAITNIVVRYKFINGLLLVCNQIDVKAADGLTRKFFHFVTGVDGVNYIFLLDVMLFHRQLLVKSEWVTDMNRSDISDIIGRVFLSNDVQGKSSHTTEIRLPQSKFLISNFNHLNKNITNDLKHAFELDRYNPVYEDFLFSESTQRFFLTDYNIAELKGDISKGRSFEEAGYTIWLLWSLTPKLTSEKDIIFLLSQQWELLFRSEESKNSKLTLDRLESVLREIVFKSALLNDCPLIDDFLGLLENIGRYISTFSSTKIVDWFRLITKLYSFQGTEDLIEQLLDRVMDRFLIDAPGQPKDEVLLSMILKDDYFVSILEDVPGIFKRFAKIFVRSERFLEQLTEISSLKIQKKLITIWIEDGFLLHMQSYIYGYFKNFDEKSIIDLLIGLVDIFRKKTAEATKLEDLQELKETGSLIVYLCEKDPYIYTQVGFQDVVFTTLTKFSIPEFINYGYELLIAEMNCISSEIRIDLLDRLKLEMENKRQFSNYTLNESLLYIFNSLEADEDFLIYVLNVILLKSNNPMIIDIYDDLLLEQISNDPQKFEKPIRQITLILQQNRITNRNYRDSIKDLLVSLYKKLVMQNTDGAAILANRIKGVVPVQDR